MSEFIANNLHKKVDHIMDVFFGAGVASHPTIIEQINYLLFMRALSQRDDELRQLGVTNDNEIVFDGELEKYHWDNLLTLNAEALFNALDECFRKIPESTTNKTVRLVFRNAHIKLFDKPSLRTVLHLIDEFGKAMDESEHEGKRDVFGDTYEYLLSKLAQAGTSGQFRTPRHIIEFIVNVVAPKKGETIIDPAVGTAGFLVKAYEYLRKEYTSPETFETGGSFDKLSNKEHTFLLEHTFTGFDSDEDMIKFGMMNLYLHGLKDAKLVRQNTLTDTAGSRDKYDIILANPPFSGKIDRDSVAEELQMNTGATEVLFLRYMMRHLTDNGRVGVIVPEGVLFNSSGAHTKIREQLLENGLWCVVSLPSGVFNPYAGVKTSILFFDKSRQDKQEVLFAKIENDGFSLGAQRRTITKNDLPEVLENIKRYKLGENLQTEIAHIVTYDRIRETKDSNLNGGQYKITDTSTPTNYPLVELASVVMINPQKSELGTLNEDMEVSFAPMADLNEFHPNFTPSSTKKICEVTTGYTYFRNEDVLLAKVTPCFENGKAGIAEGLKNDVGFGSSEYYVLRPSEKILPRYLYRLLMMEDFRQIAKNSMTGTGGLKRVPKIFLQNYKIPLPPLEVQQKIVADIENKQKAIDHAREIIQVLERERAYFDPSARAARENWPVVRIGEIAQIKGGKRTPKGTEFSSVRTNHPYIRVVDMLEETINTDSLRYVDDSIFSQIKNYTISSDDVYISIAGTIGRTGTVPSELSGALLTENAAKLVIDTSDILPQFLGLILQAKGAQEQIKNSTMSVGVPKLALNRISEISIPLPPSETQREIVTQFAEEAEIIAANRKLIKIYEQKIAQAISEI